MSIGRTPRSKDRGAGGRSWAQTLLLAVICLSSRFLGLLGQAILSTVLSNCLLIPSMSGREGNGQRVGKENKMKREREREREERRNGERGR